MSGFPTRFKIRSHQGEVGVIKVYPCVLIILLDLYYASSASVLSLTMEQLFSSDCSMLGEGHGGSPPVIGLPKHWLSR